MPERNTPPFPRRRESTIPAHAGIQRKETPSRPTRHIIPTQNYLQRHSRKGRNPPHNPSFPQRQESIPSSVIPAKAGIHNSRACGNSSSHYTNTRPKIHCHSRTGRNHPFIRHSRKGRNPSHHPSFPKGRNPSHHPSFPRRRESTIPAHAGIIVPLPQHPKKYSAIPAKAGIHPIIRHSRKGRNPPHHPSFPRRRESTIPAHAGIHRPITPTPEKILCHSRKGRNPSGNSSSVIPAKAGIHPIIRHSREGGNPSHHPSFPRRRESTIPAHAGIHRPITPTPEKMG